ncbi:MAG: hypothetical protein PHS77_03035, partial [Gallionellaceae bacterium]|nr:hypothetical protein [Gallionellaceae bacterium]
MMNPMGMMNPMTMAAPAMQMAPNMMSFGHQAPQMMTNPYMGGPFPGASTYGQPGFMGMPMPFQQPAPAAPALFPFAPQAAPAAPAQAPAMMPFDPMMMMNMFMPMPQSAPPAAK